MTGERERSSLLTRLDEMTVTVSVTALN